MDKHGIYSGGVFGNNSGIIFLFLRKNIYCANPLEVFQGCHMLVMSTHNLCFYREIKKIIQNYHQMLILYKSSEEEKKKLSGHPGHRCSVATKDRL